MLNGSKYSDLCISTVRKLSAAVDERSFQLFAPVVQFFPFGDVVRIEGIGGRLAREIHAMQAASQASMRPCGSALGDVRRTQIERAVT